MCTLPHVHTRAPQCRAWPWHGNATRCCQPGASQPTFTTIYNQHLLQSVSHSVGSWIAAEAETFALTRGWSAGADVENTAHYENLCLYVRPGFAGKEKKKTSVSKTAGHTHYFLNFSTRSFQCRVSELAQYNTHLHSFLKSKKRTDLAKTPLSPVR